MVARTMFCTQDTPANALALNKDANQIVLAGRSVFKVYSIEEDEFVERLNLRVGKNLNLNFSCADVVWNAVDEPILATAATNGAVVTWNLNKSSRSKQDIVFQDHKRTVNKVCFHDKESNLLISGSQDGTMKLFDIRKKEVTSTFYSMSESVRDVQFSPSQYFQFAAVQENGNVQLWDMRRTDRCERQFTAHNGPVFACDWHPEEKRWLATAGRDKTIKVWDVGNKPFPDHVIQTIASVSRIKWRPSRKYHLASSSLVVDFSVNVWDVRRPYVPYASFTEHKDVTSGILWRKDPKILLSVSKDCSLYQHIFQDAFRPADHINPIAIDMNPFGDFAMAASDRILSEVAEPPPVNAKTTNYTSPRLPFVFRRGQSKGEQFQLASSTFNVFANSNEMQTSSELFINFANNYQLSGRSKAELCDNNAMVAKSMNCSQIATTWSMLKILFDKDAANISSENSFRIDADKCSNHMPNEDTGSRHHSGGNQIVRSAISRSRHHSDGNERLQSVIDNQRNVKGDTSGFSDDGSESSDLEHERITSLTSVCMNNGNDYFFADSDIPNMHMLAYDYSQLDDQNLDQSSDWVLQNEPFQPRHDFDQCPPPELNSTTGDLNRMPDDEECQVIQGVNELNLMPPENEQSHLLISVNQPSQPVWDCTQTVAEMLEHYVKFGNVQMCVSILIVFGDELKYKIDEATQEQWFFAYIDLLHRYQLWCTANEIIKLSWLSNVNSMNQQSTTVHTLCNNCNRNLTKIGWYCEKCKKSTNTCSVCHQQVRGLYVWCQGCSHGGHLEHMRDWMVNHSWCPTGCGHFCEYT